MDNDKISLNPKLEEIRVTEETLDQTIECLFKAAESISDKITKNIDQINTSDIETLYNARIHQYDQLKDLYCQTVKEFQHFIKLLKEKNIELQLSSQLVKIKQDEYILELKTANSKLNSELMSLKKSFER
jgi:hypothetical protein